MGTSGRTFQLWGAVVEEHGVRDARGDGDVGFAIETRDEHGVVVGGDAQARNESRVLGRVLGTHAGDGRHEALLNHLRDAPRCVQTVKPAEDAPKAQGANGAPHMAP